MIISTIIFWTLICLGSSSFLMFLITSISKKHKERSIYYRIGCLSYSVSVLVLTFAAGDVNEKEFIITNDMICASFISLMLIFMGIYLPILWKTTDDYLSKKEIKLNKRKKRLSNMTQKFEDKRKYYSNNSLKNSNMLLVKLKKPGKMSHYIESFEYYTPSNRMILINKDFYWYPKDSWHNFKINEDDIELFINYNIYDKKITKILTK